MYYIFSFKDEQTYWCYSTLSNELAFKARIKEFDVYYLCKFAEVHKQYAHGAN